MTEEMSVWEMKLSPILWAAWPHMSRTLKMYMWIDLEIPFQ